MRGKSEKPKKVADETISAKEPRIKKTPEIIEKILSGVSGGTPLRQLCRELGIGKSIWYEWVKQDEDLAGRFARARLDGFDEIAEECLEIADDGRRDYKDSEDGGKTVDHDHIQRSKLRIETRLKLLAKWDPKRYGDRQTLEHSGPDGGPINFANLPDEELTARIKTLHAELYPEGSK